MAKRFTDTDKWKRAWFSDLDILDKVIWFYLIDNCDHAGIWNVNFKLLSYHVDNKIDREFIETHFKGKLLPIGDDKFLIPSFIKFQYGKILKRENSAHRSVIEALENIGAMEVLRRFYSGALEGALIGPKDKEKDKDKEEEKEKEDAAISIQKFRDIKARLSNANSMPPKASS